MAENWQPSKEVIKKIMVMLLNRVIRGKNFCIIDLDDKYNYAKVVDDEGEIFWVDVLSLFSKQSKEEKD